MRHENRHHGRKTFHRMPPKVSGARGPLSCIMHPTKEAVFLDILCRKDRTSCLFIVVGLDIYKRMALLRSMVSEETSETLRAQGHIYV